MRRKHWTYQKLALTNFPTKNVNRRKIFKQGGFPGERINPEWALFVEQTEKRKRTQIKQSWIIFRRCLPKDAEKFNRLYNFYRRYTWEEWTRMNSQKSQVNRKQHQKRRYPNKTKRIEKKPYPTAEKQQSWERRNIPVSIQTKNKFFCR